MNKLEKFTTEEKIVSKFNTISCRNCFKLLEKKKSKKESNLLIQILQCPSCQYEIEIISSLGKISVVKNIATAQPE